MHSFVLASNAASAALPIARAQDQISDEKQGEVLPAIPLEVEAPSEVTGAPLPPLTAPELKPNTQEPLPSPNLNKIAARAPFFWAEGIARADELEAYQRSGMNTVVVRLSWRPSEDGAIDTNDLLPQRRFAEAAAQRGLNIIYALPATPYGMERAFRVNADSAAYFNLWSMWTQKVMTQLSDTPRLIGWMLPDDPRSLPYYDDISWQHWLGQHYAEVNFLDQSWNTNFQSFNDITLQDTQTAIDAWRGVRQTDKLTLADIEALNQPQNGSVNLDEMAWHPAALALAQFKWDSYRELLKAWTQIIKTTDPEHLLFSGRLTDYAQLLALPSGIDFSVPDLPPGVAENDALTHNPQAISIARRGGRFHAIPTLTTSATPAVDGQFLSLLFPHWAETALASGASGLALSSWPDLLQNSNLRATVRDTLLRLNSGESAALWQKQPVATTAIVLTPLADGVTLQTGGALNPARGLYGFGDYLVNGGPNDLAFELRWGTAFGGIDWISPDDIDPQGATLRRYSTVLLPQALSLPNEEVVALGRFAQSGGVVVCDLGAGAVQSGARLSLLSPALSDLLGVAPFLALRRSSFNLQQLAPHPLLPTWSSDFSPSNTGRPGPALTRGDGPRGAAFSGLVGYSTPLDRTDIIALGDQWLQTAPRSRNGVAATSLHRSALTAHAIGRGFVMFAPFSMWNLWRSGYQGFDAFHGDLIARNAALAIAGAPFLVPAPPAPDQPPAYPQIINYPNVIVLLNHNPPDPNLRDSDTLQIQNQANAAVNANAPRQPNTRSEDIRRTEELNARVQKLNNTDNRGAQTVSVQTAGVGDWLWSNCITTFDASAPFGIVGGRPAPIARPEEIEARSQPVSLHARIGAGGMQTLQMAPIRVQNLSGAPISAHLIELNPSGVSLNVWPGANKVSFQTGALLVSTVDPQQFRLTLYDGKASGEYSIAPNSRHRVTMREQVLPAQTVAATQEGLKNLNTKLPPPVTKTYTANAQGHLLIEGEGSAVLVEIKPLN